MKPAPLCLLLLAAGGSVFAAAPALTIYNQNFAVVRERIPLDLKAGVTSFNFNGVTAQVEPDSVVLRDPEGKRPLSVLEQSYRAETLSQGLLLSLNEGKTITFLVRDQEGREHPVQGKVIRSGHNPAGGNETPVIQVDGQVRFSLPGEPVFPSLADDAVLKPTLSWQLRSEAAAKFEAELGYLSGGFDWEASYNLVSPEKGDSLEITGWVTINNNSGATFTEAAIKLMAGDVNKVQPSRPMGGVMMAKAMAFDSAAAPVTEKAFDEFHLYALPRPVTLRNRETKQVEFIRASGVKCETIYLYDGAEVAGYQHTDANYLRTNNSYGTQGNRKITVMREFKNSRENNLGLALPKGRVRFYRQDDADKRIEFTGENNLDHTAQGELVRLQTGQSFDLVGERKRTAFAASNRNEQMDETFEIKLRNRKKEAVEIRVVEHLYRGLNWSVTEKSQEFAKTDAQTIEFRVTVQPDEEKLVTYKAHYDWK